MTRELIREHARGPAGPHHGVVGKLAVAHLDVPIEALGGRRIWTAYFSVQILGGHRVATRIQNAVEVGGRGIVMRCDCANTASLFKMSYYADLSQDTMVESGMHIRAIGWLHEGHTFKTGMVSDEFRLRLDEFARFSEDSACLLRWPFFRGFHDCEFCKEATTVGNFGVPSGNLLYVAPEMVSHYVDAHQYLPPDEFVNAVMACPPANTSEYERLVKPFRVGADRRAWDSPRDLLRRYKQRADRFAAKEIDPVPNMVLGSFATRDPQVIADIRSILAEPDEHRQQILADELGKQLIERGVLPRPPKERPWWKLW